MTEASEDLVRRRAKARLAGKIGLAVLVATCPLVIWMGVTGGSGQALLMAVCGIVLAGVIVSIPLSATHVNRDDLARVIAAAEAFDLAPATAEYRARLGLSEPEAARHEREFRRWAALAALARDPVTTWPSQAGPLVAFRDCVASQPGLFAAFCAALPGGHASLDLHWAPYGEAGAPYANLWLAYGFAYGETPDPAVWPTATYSWLATRQMEFAAPSPDDLLAAALRALTWQEPTPAGD
jgi:hypothetical protein